MSASSSEARRALMGFLLGVALGAVIGLLARRPGTRELA